MAKIFPFNGLLPTQERVEQVAAVPYDVVNSAEAAELAAGNPYSFLHVSRPEIDMEPGVNLYSDPVYNKAAENFAKLCSEAPLKLDDAKHLYIYRLKMGDHIQTGVIGAASSDEYNRDIIKKHEKTRQDKEDDRTRHVMALRSHTGPTFLTYQDSAEITDLVNKLSQGTPLFDFTAPDDIVHTLWRVDETQSKQLAELFAKVPYLYIADGHHRSAAAARVAAECKPNNPNHTGDEDYNHFLAVTFPASQLKILSYNRAVHNLNGLGETELLEQIGKCFAISETTDPVPNEPGQFCIYLAGKWYLLKTKQNIAELGVIERLDVSILQDNILSPLLGIDDPRTSKKIDFVGGIRGTTELEKLVDSGKAAVAFSMYPTTVQQLIDIADAGEIMPPKSTWFEPKLRDGLVCHNF
jgi:uncharacterized protein (DUF1015 family)